MMNNDPDAPHGSTASRAFWNDWQLWEKFTFLLTCVIGLTMVAGAFKLIHKHRQLKAFTKLQEEKDIEQADEPQMGVVPENVVPFGIRVIESGVEVEGVWISRPNSPAPSSPASVTSTSAATPNPQTAAAAVRSPSILPSNAPEPVAQTRQPTRPAGIKSRSPVGAPMSGNNSPARTGSPTGEPIRPPRPDYKPHQASHLRYTSGNTQQDPMDEERVQNRDLTRNDKDDDSQYSPSGSTSSDSDSVLVPRSFPAKRQDAKPKYTLLQPPQNQSLINASLTSKQKGIDLDSITSYRSSQAAETGQFKARKRPDTLKTSSAKSGTHTPPSNPFDTPPQTLGLEPQSVQSFKSFAASDPNNASRSSLPLLEDVDLVDPLDSAQSKKADKWTLNTKSTWKANDDYEVLSPMSSNPFESGAEKEARRKVRRNSFFSEAI